MSIPLDRLYHYIESLCSDDIIIYRWAPHGSKKLSDLQQIKYFDQIDTLTLPILIAHDQEPLDYDHYQSQEVISSIPQLHEYESYATFTKSVPKLRRRVIPWNIHEKVLLCHSEVNSAELKKFDSHFIGVYYWSHGLIARDWFRFANYDRSLVNNPTQYKYDFLIYNRAWSGSREYRLKFAELLVNADLVGSSLTKFSPVDNGTHYTQHNFKNPKFQISNYSIEETIPANTSGSDASADYDSSDYNACGIDIVLETLFDDSRNHLTEKTLRAIACGKPFILAATKGSLQYLRSYGFKTFNGLIDESYDEIHDPGLRLEAIVAEMHRIKNLSTENKQKLFSDLNAIADYNKKLFFSPVWHELIVNEFVQNFRTALAELNEFKNGKSWLVANEIIKKNADLYRHVTTRMFTADVISTFDQIVTQLGKNP